MSSLNRITDDSAITEAPAEAVPYAFQVLVDEIVATAPRLSPDRTHELAPLLAPVSQRSPSLPAPVDADGRGVEVVSLQRGR